MGYYMTQMESNFFIKRENKEAAMHAIDVLSNSAERLAWVKREDVLRADTLEDKLYLWRWECETDFNNDIFHIEFIGEKLGDESYLFDAIAPYVRPESYIQMNGEDGSMWRWYFAAGECHELNAEIKWNTPPKSQKIYPEDLPI